MKIYVCEIETYDVVTAVAETPAQAIDTAVKKAFEYLKGRGSLTDGYETLEQIRDYWEPRANEMELNTAVFLCHCDSVGWGEDA